MHAYRTHTCGDLRAEHVGAAVRLSGWVHRKRDHGGLLFIDLRDHYGLTQLVIEPEQAFFADIERVRQESVIRIDGEVVARSDETVNANLATGAVEVRLAGFEVLSAAEELPLPVFGEPDYPEDIRMRHRYLDLRRETLHRNIMLRTQIIRAIRSGMEGRGFTEFQTPILTASSPEGARDFLTPSRLHPGKFYALPQAPQIFKQLIMVAGFDRYFQIAPCFRDEDARADRSAGEFYQLDLEMSFVEQNDVFDAVGPVIRDVFDAFAGGRPVSAYPFREIPYAEAMLKYGSDKPDLRNPIEIVDVTEIFRAEGVTFKAFLEQIAGGAVVRAIPAPGAAARPRSFFDKLNDWARKDMGAPGLGYIVFEDGEDGPTGKGPIAKFVPPDVQRALAAAAGIGPGDALFFACDHPDKAAHLAGQARTRIGETLELVDAQRFELCWIVDFPLYEYDEVTRKIDFSHNPFSMPKGELEALREADPLDVVGRQYDLVCNGYELGSGAIRNHKPEVMFEVFKVCGYSEADVRAQFGGLLNAFQHGAPPHGGCAFGIERIVMLLADQVNIREVTMFPMNQQGEDLLLGAPSEVAPEQLRELHIRVQLPPTEKKA